MDTTFVPDKLSDRAPERMLAVELIHLMEGPVHPRCLGTSMMAEVIKQRRRDATRITELTERATEELEKLSTGSHG